MASQVRPRPQYQPTPAAPKPVRGLPRQSKKRKALKAVVDPQRAAFLDDVGACMFEGCTKPACDPHEIARGAAREDCLTEFELVMGLCRKHHELVQNWKPGKQIAMRTLWQLSRTCARYCELTGTAITHVTAEEVIGYLMFRKRDNKCKKKRSNSKAVIGASTSMAMGQP